MIPTILDKLTARYPFITVVNYGKKEYIGILQNKDTIVTTFYDMAKVHNIESRQLFLKLGEQWWWESNRSIPINLFLKSDWNGFKQCLITFNTKDLSILHGPCVSLSELANKKSKRRSIILIKKLNS